MPRRNRSADDAAAPLRLGGAATTEQRRGRTWVVQPVPAANAVKVYRCPGCPRDVPVGVAHVVVWRADGVLGDAADLAARRHWHLACWRAA